jgi:hypothetical protein
VATVLFAWELGSGLGHVARFRPIAEVLLRRGHRLVAVLRDLSRVDLVLRDLAITCLQAPIKLRPDSRREQQSTSYADLLAIHGYTNLAELAVLAGAWRELFAAFHSDLIIIDHSPTALLASAGMSGKRVLLGTGFACPPDVKPLPSLRPWLTRESEQGPKVEEQVTGIISQLRTGWGQPPLERLGQLFAQVDENFLATFAELDPYPQRPNATYWGAWPGELGGVAPLWPSAAGPRVFAYLKPFPAVGALLECMRRFPCSAVVYAPEVDRTLIERCRSPQVHFSDRPVDMARALAECAAVIGIGNHATAAAALLAGKPLLLFPTVLEQFLNARNVAEVRAGMVGPSLEPEKVPMAWDAFWKSGCQQAAREFAARHADFHPTQQVERVVARIEELLNG